MDAGTISIIGFGLVIATFVGSHVLSQRQGEKRADQVKDELLQRLSLLDGRITEVKTDLKTDIRDLRADMKAGSDRLETRLEAAREAFSQELRNTRDEIIRNIPRAVNRANAGIE
jgi:predicted  nucleic acid-binding Zn-ribbon protein